MSSSSREPPINEDVDRPHTPQDDSQAMSSSSKELPIREDIDRPYTPQDGIGGSVAPGRRGVSRMSSELKRDVPYTPELSSQQSPAKRFRGSRLQRQDHPSSLDSGTASMLNSNPVQDSSGGRISSSGDQRPTRKDQFQMRSSRSSTSSAPNRKLPQQARASQQRDRIYPAGGAAPNSESDDLEMYASPPPHARQRQEESRERVHHDSAAAGRSYTSELEGSSSRRDRPRNAKRRADTPLAAFRDASSNSNSRSNFLQRSARNTVDTAESDHIHGHQSSHFSGSLAGGRFTSASPSGGSVLQRQDFPRPNIPDRNSLPQTNSRKFRPPAQRGANPLRNPDGSAPETVEECYDASIAWVRKTMRRTETDANDDDVQALTLRVSLHHPHTKQRILLPVRGTECAHVQCFDSIAYIRQHTPDWACPVCARRVPPKMLYTCAWFQRILSETKAETECVEVDRYGNFKEVKRVVPDKKADAKRFGGAKAEKVEIDDRGGGAIDLT